MQQRRVVDLPSAVFALLVSGGGVYGYLKASKYFFHILNHLFKEVCHHSSLDLHLVLCFFSVLISWQEEMSGFFLVLLIPLI